MSPHQRLARVSLLAAGSLAVLGLAGCSSSSSSEAAPSPSSSAASPSTAAAGEATCTSQSLLSALPGGADMVRFTCANAGGQEWAAARVNPGSTVFFLTWNGSAWDATTSDDVCGTASAGVPNQLLSYCQA